MLRISCSVTDVGSKWVLCGQLAGPWVQELRACWLSTQNSGPGKSAVVDLSDVTFIDERGERLLSEMRHGGIEFVATGVENKDLIENLKGNGERPLRRLVGRLKDGTGPGDDARQADCTTKREKK